MSVINLVSQVLGRTLIFNIIMSKSKEMFYAVGIGHKTGIYRSWEECKEQVDGVPNPKFRKFNSLQEAEKFVDYWRNKNPSTSPNISGQTTVTSSFTNYKKSHEEHDRQCIKGDEKLRENNFYKEKYDGEFYKNINAECGQNFDCQSVRNISDQKTGESNRKPSRKRRRTRTRKRKNYHQNEKSDVNLKECSIEFPNHNAFHSVSWNEFNQENINLLGKINVQFNQSQNQIGFSGEHYHWDSKGHINESQNALPKSQTALNKNFPVLENHYFSSTGCLINHESDFLDKPYTSPLIGYSSFLNRNINIIARKKVHDSCKLVIPDREYIMNTPCYSANENALPIMCHSSIPNFIHNSEQPTTTYTLKNSEHNRPIVEDNVRIETETDRNNHESNSIDAIEKENSTNNSTEGTVNDMREVNEYFENNVEINENKLRKLLDLSLVVSDGINSFNTTIVGDLTNRPKAKDSFKINVAESQECRESCSFSGELNDKIGVDVRNKSTMKKVAECDVTNIFEKLTDCEKRIDIGIGKVGEVLSFLTDIKMELTELKRLLPRSFTQYSKEKSSCAKSSSSDFRKRYSTNYSSGKDDGCAKSPGMDSHRFQMETDNDSDTEGQEIPAKRKRIEENIFSKPPENEVAEKIRKEASDSVHFTTDENDYVIVYTDGACSNNGKLNAKAGIGIWFGDNHPLNVAEPLKGAEPTNNNAEIQAARIACELAVNAGITKLKICSDSEFLINCITRWVDRWKSNGWMTEGKKPVKNRPELEKLLEAMARLSVRWEKVAGHSNIWGNEMADRLANEGADNYVNDDRN